VEVAGTPVVWKEKHLRVPLRQDGRMLWLKAWGFAERIGELVPGSRVDAALVLEEDPYATANGLPGWSAVLRDVRPAES
jgi:single-stranded-DNA-specific exonuclease